MTISGVVELVKLPNKIDFYIVRPYHHSTYLTVASLNSTSLPCVLQQSRNSPKLTNREKIGQMHNLTFIEN